MLIIEVTDYLDGHVARKFNKTSDVGKIYDPMCDVIYHLIMYLGLTIFFSSKIFIVVVAIILFREISIAYLRVYCAINGLVLAAMKIGKIKAATQMVSIFCCVIWLWSEKLFGAGIITGFWYWSSILTIALALIMTIASLGYYWSFVKKHLFDSSL
jgi:CDP-diacylglycerol---glycerol-3-phosphate 3-phosphatidyltransferase